MKYTEDDKTQLEAITILALKESGLKIQDKTFSDLIETIINIPYTAQTSFKQKLVVTQALIQAFVIGYKHDSTI